jgi:hypothetical protein
MKNDESKKSMFIQKLLVAHLEASNKTWAWINADVYRVTSHENWKRNSRRNLGRERGKDRRGENITQV